MNRANATPHWSDSLLQFNPCEEALKWAKQQPSEEVAYQTCQRGDWLHWLKRRKLAAAAYAADADAADAAYAAYADAADAAYAAADAAADAAAADAAAAVRLHCQQREADAIRSIAPTLPAWIAYKQTKRRLHHGN